MIYLQWVMGKATFLLAATAISLLRPAAAQTARPASVQHPDFTGIWNSSTATPIERSAQFKDKPFFTPEEAAAVEKRARALSEEQPARTPTSGFGAGYNAVYFEFSAHLLSSLRTSIITDPPDGRIPALTPAAAAEKRRREEALQHPRGARDMGLQDQCLVFPTAVPPMLYYRYNSNYQFVQTGDHLMVEAEMIHDARIIPLDGRPHLSPNVRLWLGDSVGRWEGTTLTVDTTNFNDGGGFYGEAGGMYGFDRNLHVVEHFTLVDPDTILYRFEVDDPTAFTRPWKGETAFKRSRGPVYEYACHEGNYALPNLLNGFRATEPADR
jgi:hypothetical protein